jgi:hypothetical protein
VAALTKHGRTRTPEYRIWKAIKERCTKPNVINYGDYGGRGIRMCERWANSFENFLADVGPKPSPKHSIERNDTNGNYEPNNVRWATQKEQNRNKRSNHIVTVNGARMCLAEAVERHSTADYHCVKKRLRRGWTIERALATNPRIRNQDRLVQG